jgi:hypothetical protein
VIAIRRYLSGFAGASIFIVMAYFSFNVAQGMYYNYFLWPKEKAEEHYVIPTRWQDLTFIVVFWAISLFLFLLSFRLVRFALKRPTTG